MIRTLSHKLTALWTNGRRAERIGYTVALLAFTSGLFHLIVYAIDGGSWSGPVSWRKPVTFGLSFGIVLATIVWVSTYINIRPRARNILIGVFTAASAYEVAGITVQRWRGLPSHFNNEDPVSAVIMVGLAAGGGVLVAVVIALTVLSLRRNPDAPPSMMLSVRAGLLILVAAMASGAAMIATGVVLSDTQGVEAAYRQAGWLKPTHAATMHAVTVLPALSLLTSCMDRTETWRLTVAKLATAAYAAAAAVTIAVNLVVA
ncbi:MAG: hypothetical protein ACRD0P_10535 [Stackebrandtia sp.]